MKSRDREVYLNKCSTFIIILVVAMSLTSCDKAAHEADMANDHARIEQLRQLILGERGVEGENLGRELGQKAGPVLEELARHPSVEVRLTNLDVAAVASGVGACRAILTCLSDSDRDLRELAASLIAKCSDRALLPDIVAAMRKSSEPNVRGPLALQIGKIGGKAEIKPLREMRAERNEGRSVHDLGVALARLGDVDEKQDAVARLRSYDINGRVIALEDAAYIGDSTLIDHFGLVLADQRPAIPLTLPGADPMIHARVCDIALRTMLQLGAGLSFQYVMGRPATEEELNEARLFVAERNKPQ